MNTQSSLSITRRRFLSTTAATAATACLTPRSLFAQEPQPPAMVVQARAAAATAKITTQKLRGNISVLLGSGGNIAVLPGPQGKLLVDTGISTSRRGLRSTTFTTCQATGRSSARRLGIAGNRSDLDPLAGFELGSVHRLG